MFLVHLPSNICCVLYMFVFIYIEYKANYQYTVADEFVWWCQMKLNRFPLTKDNHLPRFFFLSTSCFCNYSSDHPDTMNEIEMPWTKLEFPNETVKSGKPLQSRVRLASILYLRLSPARSLTFQALIHLLIAHYNLINVWIECITN